MNSRSLKKFNVKYGPYALVCGASEGLGAAYAEALAKRGLHLVLVARRKDLLENRAKELKEKYPVDVICLPLDLGDYETAKRRIGALEVPIGLLVYNAAYCPIGLFEETSEQQLARLVAVNITGPLLLTRLVSEAMIQNRRGGIVLMSSLAGGQGSPRLASYAASKAFNAILAEGLWKELKSRGIDVIASCAGAILTPGYKQAQHARAPGTLQAAEVAEKTLHMLGKGPIAVPGGVNKAARFLMSRIVPRKSAIAIMSNNTGALS
ncbi:MAG: SDR family NAD(P)-dependent oxidoreductase [Treponema sp.]|jgi:short-subunit dehydrogenase|nr:SDR family NAD(P)-dependent oxidoreductase [Treponema sp.]